MRTIDIINRVEQRLRDGTGRAFDEKLSVCKYLDKDNRKCAVGIFIPDGHPAQHYEGRMLNLIRHFPQNGEHPLPDFFYEQSALLTVLQEIHDDPDTWIGKGLSHSAEIKIDMLKSFYYNGIKFSFEKD